MDFEICTPAKFYLFFAFLSFLTALFYGQSFLFMIAQVIISALWIAGLNYLCKAGYVTVSWAVTLVPVWIGIILYGLTFINLNGTGAGTVSGTYAPTPGDFTRLKAATLTDIINSIFNQFMGKAQFDIKPVFDQVKKDRLKLDRDNALVTKNAAIVECADATTNLGGWGTTYLYNSYDSAGAYYTQTSNNETPSYISATDNARFNCALGVSGGVANSYPNTPNVCTQGGSAGTTHRPVQSKWTDKVTKCDTKDRATIAYDLADAANTAYTN